ncbi:MAG: N-acetylglucosamine kinase [Chitinophagaceae bacterium]|nr:N-acetylglucosamine kinase [Chitinophagaceae bacterium]
MAFIIADCGSTKSEWRIAAPGKKGKTRSLFTQGMSPYFLNAAEMEAILRRELLPQLKKQDIQSVFFYGTGCKSPENARMVKKVLQRVFAGARVEVSYDLMGAARGLCLDQKGIACILGTGSNSCYYDGRRIVRNRPGLGYVLGDEGSGAYLGIRVAQHFLYGIFEKEIADKFREKYRIDAAGILENVYKKPLPNRYLAAFSLFLSENRGHYMIENIIEDGLNDFFFMHVARYPESNKYPVHFVGGVAYHFRDVVERLCGEYGLQKGSVIQHPVEGLVRYHQMME